MSKYHYNFNTMNFETMMEKYAGAKEYLVPSAEAVQNLYRIPEGEITRENGSDGRITTEKNSNTRRKTIYAAVAALAVLVLGTVIYFGTQVTKSGNGQSFSLADTEEDTKGNGETTENTDNAIGITQKTAVVFLTTGESAGADSSSDVEFSIDDAEGSADDMEISTETHMGEEEISVQYYAVLAGECLMNSFGFDVTYIYPDDFGGCYIDYDTLYVLVTSEDSIPYYKELLADYADYVAYEIVDFSYNELYAEMEEIWNTLTEAGIMPSEGYVDQVNNSICISVSTSNFENALEILAEMGIDVEASSETLSEYAGIGEVSTREISEEEEVSFVLDEIHESSADFTITNLSSRLLQYGMDKTLEKEVDGTWYQVNMKTNYSWSDVALTLYSGGQVSVTVNWGEYGSYKELSSGHYRLIKSFDFYTIDDSGFDHYEGIFYLACEFEVP